jgi:hypothetical protein
MGEADLGVKENRLATGLSRPTKACKRSYQFVARFDLFSYVQSGRHPSLKDIRASSDL